jgi:hypothetical protein
MQTHIEIPLELDFYTRPRNFGVEVDIEALANNPHADKLSFLPTNWNIWVSLLCFFSLFMS